MLAIQCLGFRLLVANRKAVTGSALARSWPRSWLGPGSSRMVNNEDPGQIVNESWKKSNVC